MPLVADVTDLAAVEAAVAAAVAELGGLDGVANVAGVGDFTGDVTEIALDEWARVLAVNLTGAFHVSRATIPHLRSGRRRSNRQRELAVRARRVPGKPRVLRVEGRA